MSKRNDRIAQLGQFTTHPINLYKIITPNEYAFLEYIRHRINNKQYYTANETIAIEMGIKKGSSIKKYKDVLKQLDFIEILSETNKGTQYRILLDNICNIVDKLNKETNPIERFRIADNYRIEKGLKPMHENTIKKHTGGKYDISYNTDTNTETETKMEKKPVKDPDLDTLNILYSKYKKGIITEREYKLQTKEIAKNGKYKIDNNEDRWTSI